MAICQTSAHKQHAQALTILRHGYCGWHVYYWPQYLLQDAAASSVVTMKHHWIKLSLQHHSRTTFALLIFSLVTLTTIFLHFTTCHDHSCTHSDHRSTRNHTKQYKDTSLDVSATNKQSACRAMALIFRLCCQEAATWGHDMLLLPDVLSLLLTCHRYNWRSLPPDSSRSVSVPINFLHEP